ncbi:MarR family winged helix-turn-helix transcriptional regulator [uncultured Microbulbifer sp.]|uniref:MarR family winged helix-turn-helix transcriptional regulator n=1 Tax=uncultured Microbulbifer sp. TaxID=348147 RepID=UPI002605B524|nr:MarR family transcriptional regulator [uncultured Microbulbifer sp.]
MKDSEIRARMCFELHSVAHLLRRNFDRRAKSYDLTRSRWQILWNLSREEGVKQAELADRMDVARISLTRQLDLLEAEGLVERRQDTEDRRCYRLYLTAAAAPVLQVLQQLAEETRTEALAGLSAEEQRQLFGLISRVRNNVSRGEG